MSIVHCRKCITKRIQLAYVYKRHVSDSCPCRRSSLSHFDDYVGFLSDASPLARSLRNKPTVTPTTNNTPSEQLTACSLQFFLLISLALRLQWYAVVVHARRLRLRFSEVFPLTYI